MEDNKFNKAFREKLLDTFRFTINLLESHGLSWWVAYGTAIGTVRHNGLIPWDDDIDIYLPREDYEKLLDLKPELLTTKYDIISIRDNGYYLYFGKIFDKTTSLIETPHFKNNIGVYIDIFPLDVIDYDNQESHKNYFEARKIFDKYKFSLARINVKDMINLAYRGHIGTLFDWYSKFLKNAFICSDRQLQKYNTFIQLHSNPNGRYYCSFASTASNIEIYPKEWFDNYTRVPFEDMSVRLPKGYHEYLLKNYGDYMTPPPAEKQIPHHGQYYVNLKERLTVEEIEKRILKGESRVY